MKKTHKLLVAGGATGGHLFPGIAVAERFQAVLPGNKVLFVGTGRPVERRVLPVSGFDYRWITASPIKGMSVLKRLAAVMRLPKGMWEAWKIIRSFQPDMVLGVGGYSSAPVIMAAGLMGIPTAVHEQNALPGMTNRLLSRMVNRIYASFEHNGTVFPEEKTVMAGNPVRRDLCRIPLKEKNEGLFTILILGGSQGAHALNQGVTEAVREFPEKDRCRFIHQSGEDDFKAVSEAYARLSVSHLVSPFFTDMDEKYREADLLICRAGATTMAEVSVAGKAAVFVPYPFAADDHQTVNAKTFTEAGAADMIQESDLSAEALVKRWQYFLKHPAALERMGFLARKFGRPDAAAKIAEDICRFISEINESKTSGENICI